MTLQELQELQEGDLVLCVKTEEFIKNVAPSFTCGKVYIVGGRYFTRCKLELKEVLKNNIPSELIWQNLVPIKEDNQNNSNGWKHANFISLKGKDLTTVKTLYGIEE